MNKKQIMESTGMDSLTYDKIFKYSHYGIESYNTIEYYIINSKTAIITLYAEPYKEEQLFFVDGKIVDKEYCISVQNENRTRADIIRWRYYQMYMIINNLFLNVDEKIDYIQEICEYFSEMWNKFDKEECLKTTKEEEYVADELIIN